jgi:hypothetical protein
MDDVTVQYPLQLIGSLLDLTEDQMNSALSYIESNRAEVAAEYRCCQTVAGTRQLGVVGRYLYYG